MLRLLLALGLYLLSVVNGSAAKDVEGAAIWSGKMTIDRVVTVPPGATLTIQPGTELSMTSEGGLLVHGRLTAIGTAEQPIVFRPVDELSGKSWPGIVIDESADVAELKHVQVSGAAQGLHVMHSEVKVSTSQFVQGGKGIAISGRAQVEIVDVTIRAMSEVGIAASDESQAKIVGGQGRIEGCRIEEIAGIAIFAPNLTSMSIRNNSISKAKGGILVGGNFLPVEGNVIDHCETGIDVPRAGAGMAIRGNKVTNGKFGIVCHQFSAPLVEKNLLERCEEGVVCFQSSNVLIRNNRFAKNQRGISCVQMSNPLVTQNDFVDNASAIYLHLSSYATIRDNNFEDNRLHIELDNMSYDWEVRASFKPKRNRQAQNDYLVQQGRATPKEVKIDVKSEGFVDARENYWGAATTREMAKKGQKANITTIRDGHDVPVLTYEGWPGEYKVDKVRFDGWKKARVTGTYQQ